MLVPGAARIAVFLHLVAGILSAAPSFKEVDAALGLRLFEDNSLWDESDSEIAGRLGWVPESQNQQNTSFRGDSGEQTRVLGSRPYSMTLRGRDYHPIEVSIVFANKWEYGGMADAANAIRDGELVGRERVKVRRQWNKAMAGFEQAIVKDATDLKKQLEALLGPPSHEKNEQGLQLREHVYRWDWNGHAFLLTINRDNYVGLKIVPADRADSGGRSERLSDGVLRAKLKERVIQRPNGDVIISELPMANQGQKGFCVTATLERYLRYFGIETDMYSISTASGSLQEGGTSLDAMEKAVYPVLKRNLRKLVLVSPDLRPAAISNYIDKGLPLIWGMYSMPEFNETINARMQLRSTITDQDEWEKQLKKARAQVNRIKTSVEQAHACMIIGYNRKTDELAVSDSWGPEYAERWITVREARRISMEYLRVLSW